MKRDTVDLLVVGSGLCGLTIAITAAQRGMTVRCVGDGRPGASLANFGQLHSGAVFAPVLPDTARECWTHRYRWHDLAAQANVSTPHGYGLFTSADTAAVYQRAWQEVGIDAAEVDPADLAMSGTYPPPAAAFRLPDFSVDLAHLHHLTTGLALTSGVLLDTTRPVTPRRDRGSTTVSVDGVEAAANMIVLATGAETPALLDGAGITHTLSTRQIPWATVTGATTRHVTYWLDDDLLALSPTRDGFCAGQPGIQGNYGTPEAETQRLRTALDHHRIGVSDDQLTLRWGAVCEPTAAHVATTTYVADLRRPPDGWSRANNLLIALPGKWVTAWHCADRVVDLL
ncbi:MAG: FAD-binding oxidoreductase [Dactylosporangium sp.]|nr:FAD-binding oxidoreductase [Dactylosporangium sp.]NNJ62889.1 FAD-binding oxidoreductase [Dactylosporangium sp.]